MPGAAHDLTRTTLAVLFIAALIVLSFLVIRPFAAPTLWAATLVLATWPLMLKLEAVFGGRRAPAAAVMTLALLLLVVVPIAMAIVSLAGYAQSLLSSHGAELHFALPPPPAWLSDIPLVGKPVSDKWQEFTTIGTDEIATTLRPHAGTIAAWILAAIGGFGSGLLHSLLTIAIVALLYAKGEAAADWCRSFGRRLADERGDKAVVLAGQAIRGVALGVVVTALAQTFCTAVALAVVGIPNAGVLAGVALFLCIAQLGPGLVILPAVIWLFATGQTVSGIVLTAIGIPILLMDNVLRPILIRRGADLPFLLILAGVIGGLLAFGMLGLFVGPVILAVTFTLLQNWIGGSKLDE
jgi:predicted PurR-regulated permease PerM